MRASSFFIFFILTFVLFFFAEAIPKTNFQKTKENPNLEEHEGAAESVQLDSLSISDLNNRPTLNYTEPISMLKPKPKYIFLPTVGLYSGPTANQDSISTMTFGINFNKLYEDFESLSFAFTISTTTDMFFKISNQFMLAPKTWGNPYWNINMNFAIDPGQALASLMNMQNFSIGLTYGVRLNNVWTLEGNLGILSLKGTAMGINAIYTLSL